MDLNVLVHIKYLVETCYRLLCTSFAVRELHSLWCKLRFVMCRKVLISGKQTTYVACLKLPHFQ